MPLELGPGCTCSVVQILRVDYFPLKQSVLVCIGENLPKVLNIQPQGRLKAEA